MDIPVYLIAGFLDSGKTGFINGILRDGFAEEDRTLLICCEEGELEYDPRVLGNVFTYTVDEQSQLTPELFKKLEKQYRPKQVIIEYNGMWMIEPLYRDGLPANWILYQIMCLVDARSFEMYVKNMGQLMMEKISNADMLIFNHCNEELRAQLRSRNLRMVNRRADIYLENEDGTSEEYVTPEMSPFDLSDGHLDVPDDDYGVWYVDMMDNPDRYDGVTVRYKAVMCHSKKFKGVHCPGRFAMVCCENDMQFLALVAKGEGLERFKDRQWVEITATVKRRPTTLIRARVRCCMSPPSPPAKSPRKRSSPSDDPPAWLCVNHVKERKGELPHDPKRKDLSGPDRPASAPDVGRREQHPLRQRRRLPDHALAPSITS